MHSVRLIAPPWLTPNQLPFNLANTINAGATLSIVPANTPLYLHTVYISIDPGGTNSANCQVQDQTGTTYANLNVEYLNAAVGTFVPPRPPIDFKGVFLGNLGLRLKNPGGSAIGVFGFITYSLYTNPPS